MFATSYGCFLLSTGPLLPCQEKLGVESGNITDDQLRSSSDVGNGARKTQWRLNQIPNPSVPGGWVALDSDEQPWLQISLYRQTSITGIIVQGREDEDQWVTSYKVQTCLDGTSWTFVPGIDINGEASEEEVSCFVLDVYSKDRFMHEHILQFKLIATFDYGLIRKNDLVS